MSDERLTRDERRATMSFVASDTASPSAAGALCPRLEVGATLAGRYRVIRFIAEGGTGQVYEAHDALLDDRIAVKVLRCDVSHHATTIERFRREVSLAHKVTHPNVCRLFEIGQDGATAYLTMELLEGESLSARLDRLGKMSVEEALPIARGLAAGLGAAHAAGIIHRDFKSQNVILAGDRAVVTDFGLARCAKDHDATLTGAGVLVGTPAYMAPEQVEGGELTTRTDVYAFGVVLFEMVTGRLPFIGASPLATAIMRIKADAPRARSIVPDLDARWDAAIAKCLAAEPAARFATVEEVIAALTGPMPALVRMAGPVRKTLRGGTLAAGVSGVAVIAGVAIVALVSSSGGGRGAARGEEVSAEASALPRAPLPPRPPPPPEPVITPREAMVLADEGRREMERSAVRAVDENTYVIVPDLIEELAGDQPEKWMGKARIVPLVVDDKPAGFKIYAIEEDSWPARLGLENGDAIVAINDMPVAGPESLIKLEPELRKANVWRVSVKRKGEARTLTYKLLR